MYKEITDVAAKVLSSEFGIKDTSIFWNIPRERERGDLSTTIALELGKKLKKKPLEIAETLSNALAKSSLIEKAEAVAPGYVNITLTPTALLKELNQTRQAQAERVAKKNKPVVVDYSQPNIAKPLGIHHILSTIIGQAVCNVQMHQGTPVVRWNYMGDWGTQFGKLAVAYKKWGSDKPVADYSIDELLSLYVKFHDAAEKDVSLEEQARAAFQLLVEGDATARAFWWHVVAVTKQSLKKIYDRLGVAFDVEIGESFYEDKMQSIVEEGKKKNVFMEGEKGALIAKFDEASGMPPAVIVKGDGSTLYHTRDLALVRHRIEEWHAEAIFYVVDVAQMLHFKQLFAIEAQLAWDLPKQEHIAFGRMRFADGSMSTRKGNILKLEEVLNEAVKRADAIIQERGDAIQSDDPKELAEMMGIGAIVYGILSQNRKMDMVFDWGKMLSFEGNSAPYLQSTHARTRSILRKAEMESCDLPEKIETLTEKERLLIGTLLRFSDVLQDALEQHMPHKIANYLYELCQDYNAFYTSEPILKAPEPERALRIALTSFTAGVLKTGATLLTLRVPDRM